MKYYTKVSMSSSIWDLGSCWIKTRRCLRVCGPPNEALITGYWIPLELPAVSFPWFRSLLPVGEPLAHGMTSAWVLQGVWWWIMLACLWVLENRSQSCSQSSCWGGERVVPPPQQLEEPSWPAQPTVSCRILCLTGLNHLQDGVLGWQYTKNT